MTENATSADNQQERLDKLVCNYVSGFVDGEGCFHVALQRNPTTKLGIQVVPEFQVSQHFDSVEVLELLIQVLDCGYLKPNHPKNPRDLTWVYVVRSYKDLAEKVIPFFQNFQLRTAKRIDFEKFVQIIDLMKDGQHKTKPGLAHITQIAISMNRNGQYRKNSNLLTRILRDYTPESQII